MEKVRLGNDFILKLVLYKVDDQLVLDNDGNPISGTPEDLTTAKNLTLKLYNLKYRKEYNLIKSVNINTIQTEILSNIQQIGQHYVLLEYDQSNEQFDSGYQHFKVGLYSFEILSQTSNIEIIDQIILCSCVNSGSGPGQIDLSNYVKNTDLNQTLLAYAKSEDLSLKVDKINGKQLSDNNYTTADKNKLSGISDNANLYIHPENHPPSIITQDSNNRFVSDNEKSIWNNKQNTIGFTPENIANKNIANGYAGLDGNGKILSSNLPEASSPVISVSGKTGIVNLDKNDVGLNNVDNTSLSTWNGSSNINQVGTIQTGVWEGEIISLEKGGTGLNTIGQPNQILKVNSLGNGLEYASASENSSGTVTSVSMTVPTGLTVTGSPVTTAGTFALSLTSGYSIPTTAKQTNWDTAYGWGNHAGLYQPIDSDLTAIAALSGTSGLLKKTAADTWSLDTTSYATTSALDLKVDKIAGKDLSTEDFTSELLTKLSGIETGAQVNVQSDWSATEGATLILNKPNISDLSKKTLTSTLSSASYFKFAETTIDPRGYMGHFRITVDSTTTAIGQILDVWVMSSGENVPLVWAMSNTKSTTAATTGVYNIRCIYPKTLDNGYNAQFELAANNTTARTIKIELISSSNVTLLSDLVASAPNATYQTTGSAVVVGIDGLVVGGTIYGNVSGSAGSAGQAPLINNPFTTYTAEIALVANDLIILGADLKWYKASNSGVTIPIGTVIASCGTTYALNATVATSYLIGSRTLQTGTSGTKNIGKDLYIRGTISGQNLVTDGYLTTELEAGYSYIRLGALITATSLYLDGNNRLITLDNSSLLSKLDGYSFAASKVNGFTVDANVPSGALFTDTISDWNAITGNAVILNKPTTLLGYGITDAQEKSNDLTAIDALSGTSGFLKKTAADSWSLDTNTYLTGNQTITLSGAVSGSGTTAITTAYAGTVPTNKGGTGLTSIGTAGQYLAVNSSATGLEWINSRDKGVNTVTTLASLPITKRLVTATVTAATTLSLASALEIGDELHVIVYNSSASAITQTLPNSGSYISLSGTSISIPAGGRIEINILCYATTSYIIRAL